MHNCLNCEGIRGVENVLKMHRVKDVVRNAKFKNYDWWGYECARIYGYLINVRIRMKNF